MIFASERRRLLEESAAIVRRVPIPPRDKSLGFLGGYFMNRKMIVEIKIIEPSYYHKLCSVQMPEEALVLIHDEVHITEHIEPSEICSKCGQGKIPEKKIYFCRGPHNNISGFSISDAIANYCQSIIDFKLSMRI